MFKRPWEESRFNNGGDCLGVLCPETGSLTSVTKANLEEL
jgi:hypothetical protein